MPGGGSAGQTLTGPVTALDCPASVTFAGTVPAGTASLAWFPLASPLMTLDEPA